MPGDRLEDALAAALPLQAAGIGTMYTRLGENLDDLAAADEVAAHYLEARAELARALDQGTLTPKVYAQLAALQFDFLADVASAFELVERGQRIRSDPIQFTPDCARAGDQRRIAIDHAQGVTRRGTRKRQVLRRTQSTVIGSPVLQRAIHEQ